MIQRRMKRIGDTELRGASLMEWELGSRVTADLLAENHELLGERALKLRLAKAWPKEASLVSWMNKYVVLEDDPDIYKVIGVSDNGKVTLRQETGNTDGKYQYWTCFPDLIEDSISQEEFEDEQYETMNFCRTCDEYHKPGLHDAKEVHA